VVDETEHPEENEQAEELIEEHPPQNVFLIDAGNKGPKFRAVSLFGNLEEETLADVVQSLVALNEAAMEENARREEEEELPSLRFYISTWGGDVHGMFAVYDLMRSVREEVEIETIGLGKVMSAGVLLLAAGTKGMRTVGRNTRIMLHGIKSATHGGIPSLENEMEETRWLQDRMVEALAAESKLTKSKIQKMIAKRIDYYISAEEAVEMGIADIII
jgi:ATP-dependent Clp protease protease subunit